MMIKARIFDRITPVVKSKKSNFMAPFAKVTLRVIIPNPSRILNNYPAKQPVTAIILYPYLDSAEFDT